MEQIFYLPSSMLWPLAACLVLTGIHVYLGVHVVARKVIFVDLALAQIAALGTVVGVLLGFEAGKDTTALYLYSLAFTIFGAFIFSITKMKAEKVPHEAVIGIVYAVTFAATMLVLSRSALGPQELDHIIKGELLWVQGPIVIKTALIYTVVGAFHFVFRKKFMAISFDSAKAEEDGVNVRLWDFLFYMSFGFVITSSVAIAGVFLVFSYLVIPSVGAMLLSEKLGTRLAIGWIGGSLCSFVGVKLSWSTGLPTSPLVVCVLAFALIASGLFYFVKASRNKKVLVKNIIQSISVVGVFVVLIFLFRKGEEDPLEHYIHMLESNLATDRVTAINNLQSFSSEREQWLPLLAQRLKDRDAEVRRTAIGLLVRLEEKEAVKSILELLKDESDLVRQDAVNAVRALGSVSDAHVLTERAAEEPDPEMKLEMLSAALQMGSSESIEPLVGIVQEGGLFGEDARAVLVKFVQLPERMKGSRDLITWLNDHRANLQWNKDSGMYSVRE